ncbi:hypothetical protein J2W54_002271 [Rhodococcus fascians]|uniref:hypothetical protein n=1 Tax=Nocardiaceae TaxID=85025 RepID=UPI00050C5CB8|nr:MULTISPECIES: hypothetical protein [Rhodococcus]MDR6910744.1 hypothetical protein [Rhodococcus sp. 3258]MDR6931889.1 hypothetical protein [Rhodococcus fascians]
MTTRDRSAGITITTEFTRFSGIDHPSVCGEVTGVGSTDLIVAVANAGARRFSTARDGASVEDVAHRPSETRRRAPVLFGGDKGDEMLWARRSHTSIDEVASCAEAIDRITADAARTFAHRRTSSLTGSHAPA